MVRTVMFDSAKELVAGRMKERCDERGVRIITSVPYSPHRMALQPMVLESCCETQASLRGSGRKR